MYRSMIFAPFAKWVAPLVVAGLLLSSLACSSSPGPRTAPAPPPVTVGQGAVGNEATPEALLEAEAMLVAGRAEAAAEVLETHLMVHAEDRRALDLLGRARFEQGRYEDAKLYLLLAISLSDEDAMTHLWMGKVLAEEIERVMLFAKLPLAKQLLAHFERAAELDPLSVPAHTALARFHLEAPAMAGGDGERLQHYIDRLHVLDPAAGHRMEARRYRRLNDPAAAERELRLALAAAPLEAENHLDLGALMLQLERPEEALSLLRRAVSLAPRPGEAHFRLAEAALQVASPPLQEARDALLAYVQLHPSHDQPGLGDAWFQLGRIEQALGDEAAARAGYRRALQESPKHQQAKRALQALGDGD